MKILSVFFVTISLLTLSSCKHTTLEGEYMVMGFTLTNEAVAEGVTVTSSPVFVFSDKSLQIKGDFNFNCFDSEQYKYRIKDGMIQLKKKSDSRIFYITSSDKRIELAIDDNKYIQRVVLIKK